MAALSAESVLEFESDAVGDDIASLRLAQVSGREALSTPYTYVLELASDLDGGLSPESIDALLVKPCRFRFGGLQVSGIVEELRVLPTVDPRDVHYELVLVPRLAALAHTERSRVFQTKTVLEIVGAVLSEHRVPFQLSTAATYPTEEYVVQYAESDLAFVSRLLEHRGIFYFFEQTDGGETLVLGDRNEAFAPSALFPELAFSPGSDGGLVTGTIDALRRHHRPRPGKVHVFDYNWRAPYADAEGHKTARQLQLRVEQPADTSTGRGEVWRYAEHAKELADATAIAAARAQALISERVRYEGSLFAPGLAPGQRFTATGMPLSEHDQQYVIVSMQTAIVAGEGAVQRQDVELLAATVAYRPPLRTPRPKIAGFMHAVVDGELHGTAAPIDDLGRYRLLMPYDVAAAPGGRASRWVRMAQPSAGARYGMHLPLHIGTEVAVLHLDGDPDRPIIAGALPNVDDVSPVTSANATQSRIVTRSNILFELDDDAR